MGGAAGAFASAAFFAGWALPLFGAFPAFPPRAIPPAAARPPRPAPGHPSALRQSRPRFCPFSVYIKARMRYNTILSPGMGRTPLGPPACPRNIVLKESSYVHLESPP